MRTENDEAADEMAGPPAAAESDIEVIEGLRNTKAEDKSGWTNGAIVIRVKGMIRPIRLAPLRATGRVAKRLRPSSPPPQAPAGLLKMVGRKVDRMTG